MFQHYKLIKDTILRTRSHLHLPYEQLLQWFIEHHYTGSVRQCGFWSRDSGRFGWRRTAHSFSLGFWGRFFVLNAMREAKFKDLLAQLIYNLIFFKKNTQTTEKIYISLYRCTQCLEPYFNSSTFHKLLLFFHYCTS